MQLSMNIQTPPPGLPAPKKPNLNTQANIAMSITFLMPNLFMQIGMRSMQSVSEICEMEMRALALFAPQLSAYPAMSLNEEMKVLA